jgi:aflatoxin B1 aldehyde reductase
MKNANNKMKLILGTMTFGPQVDTIGSRAMVECFLGAGYHELDTAYVYNEGETERILGSILPEIGNTHVHLATKVNPRITGRLDADAVDLQLTESLRRLGRDQIDLLYFHFPDLNTPIEGALEACAKFYAEGKFKEFGLSNFPAWMVVDIWHICKERGWPRPSVYQGMYNGLSRKPESELFPALRKLGIRFYAYNPLAGGMLTGKHTTYDESPMPGRFARLQSYRNRYWKRSYFEAVDVLVKTCREAGIPPAEAAYRWLACHSCLEPTAGDGILVGASSMQQLEQNLLALEKGALPEAVASAFEAAWEEARPESPEYFTFYTG